MRLSCLLAFSFATAVSHAAANKERIVAVGGGVTEIVFALGRGRSVVATDTSSYFPKKAAELPKVGYQRNLAAEGILSHQPTMVLAAEEAGPPAVLRQLKSAGVRIETLNTSPTVEGLVQRIKRLGELLNEPERAAVLASDIKASFRDIKKQQKQLTQDPRRVLFIMQHKGSAPRVAGADTNIDTLIRLSGATNAAAELSGFRTLSTEAMVSLNPDVILTTSQSLEAMGGEARLWGIPGISRTTAGRERQVIAMDALLLMGFSVRSPVATRRLLTAWQSLEPAQHSVSAQTN